MFPVTKDTKIGVIVTESPIVWDKEYVRVLFIVARGMDADPGYEDIGYLQKLISDIHFVYRMINCQKYEEMVDIITTYFIELI